eukprot:TRINITY_DN7101_c0_g2_i2.p1 TRINITY_DN7101_c0_g2~~TRINITY_DN7101_c0_g2_i2.p1  ORF type:complete len:982 (+),score=186.08 TRINITY_DN7101_c0_g2_i2:55-3000(+)
MTSEVGILLERIGLERYKDTLANHGMHTLEDLRQGKAVLALALPLGPKARLLKELNTTEGEASLGGDEYGTLINIVRPYMDILSGLTSKLAEAARRNPGGSAGKQYIIASTTLKLCEKVIRDSQRYQLLSKRNTSHSQADMASCKVSVGSSIRQLRQQQQQGIMRTLEEADPQCILPVLDLSQTTLGQVYKTTSPKKKNRTSSAVVDSQVIGQLKQLTRPPEQVKSTVYMMLKLFGYDELTWGDAKSRMGSHAFQVELANFNPSEIPDSAVVQLGEFLRDPETMANEVAACCHEAGIIALWMLQIYNSLTGSELKASEASIISPVRPAQNPTRTHAKSTPTSAGMGTGTGANNSQRSRKSTLPIEERERQLAEKEELLKRREEYIAEEEQRLKRKELDLEKSGKLSAQGGSVGDVLHQIEALKMMIEKAPVDRQLLSKVNSLSRAAATSRALLAYYSANKKRSVASEEVSDEIPVGSHVRLKVWNKGTVTGQHRGRIGVKIDKRHVGVVPQMLRRVQNELCPEEEFPIGTPVELGGQRGVVTGFARGRVGVELQDGAKVGVIPEKLRALSEDEVLGGLFPMGLEVVLLEKGTVAGCSRGRVGLVMSDGSQRGCIPEQLRKLPEENIKTAFPTGTKVVISASNTPATVTGYARGRLGLELEDGTKRGAIPTEVIREDSKEGLLRDFPIGCTVQVSSLRGEVMSHARGRIGVQLDNGETRGVLPCNLRAVELSQQEMTEKYSVGTVVAIGAQRGKVTGCSRGRIGVELDDGTKRGVIPQKLRILTAAEISMNSRFDVGAEVEVLEEPEGHVVGKGRGRLGVMLADGRKVGCMLAQATVIEHTVSEDFPVGCHVDVMLKGKVTGCSRGRVGIELPGGAKVGCLPNALRKTDTCQDFAVGSNVMYEGSLARVTGHSRGRVGIEVPGRGALGVVPTALSTARKPVVCYHQLKALAPSVQDKTVEELMEVALDEHHTLVTEVYSLLE